jgi:hypothetical protein
VNLFKLKPLTQEGLLSSRIAAEKREKGEKEAGEGGNVSQSVCKIIK